MEKRTCEFVHMHAMHMSQLDQLTPARVYKVYTVYKRNFNARLITPIRIKLI